ncbi:sphingomyelin phosphodiesterase [Galendromus occidentalis]|uniref:Sphingomyelin phosphodiesterase n=1 Tax=Galendromus occidentalis TaxID=34638 RepID=A0AAJ7SJA6_9ACAR|nr:sphingomyelin phosphodiesterase [Galendromus occidentalis]
MEILCNARDFMIPKLFMSIIPAVISLYWFGDLPDSASSIRLRRLDSNSICSIPLSDLWGPKLPDLPSVMDTFKSGVTTNETCGTCRSSVQAFKVALKSYSKTDLARWGKIGCNTFVSDLTAPEVCLGLLRNYIDIVHHIAELVVYEKISESDICSLIFGPRCGEISAPTHIWEVVLPPALKKRPKAPQAANNIKILHLSDFHYDPRYREGAQAQCDLPLCCREPPEETEDPMGNQSMASLSGRFGDLRHCDMPMETIESLVDDAVNLTVNLSHIYLTGDIPPHDVWKSDKQEYFNITKAVYDLLRNRFSVKVFPVIGNHEAVPPNMFSTERGALPTLRETPELYANLASFWSPWLGEEQSQTIRHGGYYAISISPVLKVIALNTNFCYYLNFWLLADSRDPAGQLAWLVRELQDSEVRGQKVHLLGHVPPGSFDCVHTWSAQFLRIVERFGSTITGQFYGHTHYDEFRVFYGANRVTPVGAAFIAPSATSYSAVNPAYKVFTYREQGVLLDSVTRTFNLTRANEEGRIDWETEYESRLIYEVNDLSPASMDAISRRLSQNPDVFQNYYRFYHRSSPSATWSECATLCQESIACSTRTDVPHDNSACLNAHPSREDR